MGGYKAPTPKPKGMKKPKPPPAPPDIKADPYGFWRNLTDRERQVYASLHYAIACGREIVITIVGESNLPDFEIETKGD